MLNTINCWKKKLTTSAKTITCFILYFPSLLESALFYFRVKNWLCIIIADQRNVFIYEWVFSSEVFPMVSEYSESNDDVVGWIAKTDVSLKLRNIFEQQKIEYCKTDNRLLKLICMNRFGAPFEKWSRGKSQNLNLVARSNWCLLEKFIIWIGLGAHTTLVDALLLNSRENPRQPRPVLYVPLLCGGQISNSVNVWYVGIMISV